MSDAVIQVKFFASLREHVGFSGAEITDDKVTCVKEVWDSATANMAMPANTLVAVNLDYVDVSHAVKLGDEVAFFPPVTGG